MNATLIGQLITFAVLVWFINHFLWEPITGMLENRKKRIADGLAAGEKGRHELELAEKRAVDQIKKAKGQANEIISQAQRRAGEIVEEGKENARAEGDRLLVAARAVIDQEMQQAREQLKSEVAGLAVTGAEQILLREVNRAAHKDILDKLAAQL
ncbi:MAG: F0F1 ATP synthase subunit B [Gammaproteobacteria bacterium]|nr:F0F1 ATP synthase subunit B [Gammaproteobacteria bacterium]MCI0590161.1 F0F1 ATP synthase subunit B [Gammaproteobacteria bacterium]